MQVEGEEMIEPFYRFVEGLVPVGASVLDVGVGDGVMGFVLSKKGCRVTGTNLPIKSHCRVEFEDYAGGIFVADLEDVNFCFDVPELFSFVLCLNVLEHTKKHSLVLNNLRCVLNDNSMLILSVPNVAFWKNRLNLLFGKWDYTQQGILAEQHVHFFTEKALLELLEANGLRIDRIHFFGGLPVLNKLFPRVFCDMIIVEARK